VRADRSLEHRNPGRISRRADRRISPNRCKSLGLVGPELVDIGLTNAGLISPGLTGLINPGVINLGRINLGKVRCFRSIASTCLRWTLTDMAIRRDHRIRSQASGLKRAAQCDYPAMRKAHRSSGQALCSRDCPKRKSCHLFCRFVPADLLPGVLGVD
jgi:hypothetical protein